MNVIVKGRRYILGETETHFAIWDVHGGDDPIETFPLTPEGFDEAEARFSELRRLRRVRRGSYSKALRVALITGVAAWVLAGLLHLLLAVFGFVGLEFGAAAQFFFASDQLGFRVGLGAALILVTHLLQRLSRGDREPPPIEERGSEVWTFGLGDGALRGTALVGLVLWLAGGVAVQALYRGGPLSFEPPDRTVGAIFAGVVDSLGFRLWVASLALLLLRGVGRLVPPRV